MAHRLDRSAKDIGARAERFARFWLLTVASLGVLLVIASMVGLNAAMPDLALATGASQTDLTWIVDGYTLVLACLLLPAGALGDRYGRRGAMLFGLALFAVASAAPLIFDAPLHIIMARLVAGAGAAFVMPATLSLLTASFPKEERNKAVGIWAGTASAAAIVGFLGTGLLLEFYSWQSIFWAFTAAAIALLLCTLTIPTSRDESNTPLDWLGAVTIGAAVALFVYGMIEAPRYGWSHPAVWGCLAAGVVLAGVFAVVELRHDAPMLDVRLFARPDFGTGALGITCLFFSNFGFFFVEMQYLQLVMGYSALQTAFALAPLAVPIIILGATMHLYLPRVGLRTTVASGLAFQAGGLFLLSRIDEGAQYTDLVTPLLVMAIGIGLCVAPSTSAITNAVPLEKQGVASAVNDTSREVGAAIGIAVAGSVLAAQYSSALAPALAAFPEQVRDAAADSLAAAMEIAQQLGPAGAGLVEAATAAFIDAMGLSLVVLATALAVVAAIVAVWAPGRDGEQFGFLARRAESPDEPSDDELGDAVADHADGGVRAAAGDRGQD